MNNGKIENDSSVNEAFNNKKILEKASLLEPFVCKVKRVMNINNNNVRTINDLKEVINNE